MFETGFSQVSLQTCLANVPPVELKGMVLLKDAQHPQHYPAGQFFPTGLPREVVAEAVTELVGYTRRCQQAMSAARAACGDPADDVCTSRVRLMNALLETYALLAQAMLDDPFLALANAVAWLDPLWQMPEDYEYGEGEDVSRALRVTRGVFPAIYAGAVERIRAGASYALLDGYVCSEVRRLGIPLEALEYLAYGIPLPAHGINLSLPELSTEQPDLARILRLFGIQPDADDWRIEVPDEAYVVGRLLAESLIKQKDARWPQVGWALAWLFSCTGNSLIDCDDEALAEIEPLAWDAENVAFAREIMAEADGILKDVAAGLAHIQAEPDTFRVLSENVDRAYRKLTHRKDLNREPHLRLRWPCFTQPSLDRSADRAAVAGAELLQLRRDAA